MPDFPRGVDISNWQKTIDWATVAASGVAFAFAKATEGVGYVDPYFAPNWLGMKANGTMRGAYHYAKPDLNGPEAEAEFFCNHVEATGLAAGDILALDLEEGTGDLSDWTARFLAHVRQRMGFDAIVYSSPAFIQDHALANRPEIGQVGLWLASWNVPTPPQAPAPWDIVAFHQHADDGTVPGIAGKVDLNRFNGDAAAIPLYGKPAAQPEPAPEPEPSFVVGPGLLAAMTQNGEQPASSEVFFGESGQGWSEAFSGIGRRYTYIASTGKIVVSEGWT
jgi:GH25 family lysozyme M1 (1,4-beta-N-acetylmuramidase)